MPHRTEHHTDHVDTGMKEAVFQPFEQGDTEAARVGGLGIGLSLVETYARLHGGRARVEDRDGGGASFLVLLPERTSVRLGEEPGRLDRACLGGLTTPHGVTG